MTTNKHISHIGAGGGWLSLIWHSSCYLHKFKVPAPNDKF